MIPHLVALALQADGWYLRSEVVWSKANPMPESVTDRPTDAHEMLFLLSKRPRYYYDADAVREAAGDWGMRDRSEAKHNTEGFRSAGQLPHRGLTDCNAAASGRNRRSVWTIATQPFPGAHFAVMPPALVLPCILAGTSARGCCPACGAGWVRVVEKGASSWDRRRADGDPVRYGLDGNAAPLARSLSNDDDRAAGGFGVPATRCFVGWSPSCTCWKGDSLPPDAESAVVLDPFAGVGTVPLVARENGRDYLGIELNPEYAALAEARIANRGRVVADEALPGQLGMFGEAKQ